MYYAPDDPTISSPALVLSVVDASCAEVFVNLFTDGPSCIEYTPWETKELRRANLVIYDTGDCKKFLIADTLGTARVAMGLPPIPLCENFKLNVSVSLHHISVAFINNSSACIALPKEVMHLHTKKHSWYL